MQKKIKWAMKQFIKKEGKEKKQRARLRKIEIDPKKVPILVCALLRKICLITSL